MTSEWFYLGANFSPGTTDVQQRRIQNLPLNIFMKSSFLVLSQDSENASENRRAQCGYSSLVFIHCFYTKVKFRKVGFKAQNLTFLNKMNH